MITMEAIQRLAGQIVRELHPQRIRLFGTLAGGRPSRHSDPGIQDIMPCQCKSREISAQIRSRLRRIFPLDLLVRSPDQLRERLALGDPFLKDIMRNGKVLYESSEPYAQTFGSWR